MVRSKQPIEGKSTHANHGEGYQAKRATAQKWNNKGPLKGNVNMNAGTPRHGVDRGGHRG
jgi:hypothetical protein